MTQDTGDHFFTPNYARLTRIAKIAIIFAWIIFILNTLNVLISILGSSYFQARNSFGVTTNIIENILANPANFANSILQWASIFLRGVVSWLMLKGLSLGLNMIVETALNYNKKFQGEENELRPSQTNLR